MSSGSRKIREERLTAFEGMKALMEKIDRGERLTVEERADFDARNRRISELEADLRTAEAAEKLAADMRADSNAPAPTLINPVEARERAFSSYLRTGVVAPEMRDMGEGTLTAGGASSTPGYLVPPGWWQRLQVALKVYGGIARDFEQLETESGQSLQWATVDPTSVVGVQVGENPAAYGATGSIAEQDYTFGQGVLNAYMFTSGVQKVSIQLANDSAFDIDAFVAARVSESLGRAQAAAAVSGSGSSAPLGINTALAGKTWSAGGSGGAVALTASQSINIGGASSTELAANTVGVATLRELVASVDPAYRTLGAKFYMNDAQLLGIRGLTDNNGRPLVNMQDGITPGAPTTIWGYEVVVDNNIPNLTASTVGGPIFGHLASAMVLRTVTQSGLLRLDQRFADQLQVGYIGYMRFDMRSNDLRAASVVKAALT